MAKAKTKPSKPKYVLSLTQGEAETLFAVTARTSGDPEVSRRQDLDNIGAALRSAGITRSAPGVDRAVQEIRNGLSFVKRGETGNVSF